MSRKFSKALRVIAPWLAFAFLLLACDVSSLVGGATPVTIIVTATPQAVAVQPTAAPTQAAAVQPTATERVVVVTATPPPPTDTAVPPTPTPIVIVVTATLPPQPVVQPTARPAGFKYTAPANVAPANGAGTPARCLPVTFSWTGPTLAAGEWFVLEKAKADHPNEWTGMTDWTQQTSVDLGPTRTGGGCYYAFYDNYGTYIWHVRIVRGDKSTHTIAADLSPASQPTTVVYGP